MANPTCSQAVMMVSSSRRPGKLCCAELLGSVAPASGQFARIHSEFSSRRRGRRMATGNGRPPGRPPHKNSRAALPMPGDEQYGDYSRERLLRMDSALDAIISIPAASSRPPRYRRTEIAGGAPRRLCTTGSLVIWLLAMSETSMSDSPRLPETKPATCHSVSAWPSRTRTSKDSLPLADPGKRRSFVGFHEPFLSALTHSCHVYGRRPLTRPSPAKKYSEDFLCSSLHLWGRARLPSRAV
jgi:hypothetical protein